MFYLTDFVKFQSSVLGHVIRLKIIDQHLPLPRTPSPVPQLSVGMTLQMEGCGAASTSVLEVALAHWPWGDVPEKRETIIL